MSIDRYTFRLNTDKSKKTPENYDTTICVSEFSKSHKDWKPYIPESATPIGKDLLQLAQRLLIKAKSGEVLWYDAAPLQRDALVLIDSTQTSFKLLSLSKDIVSALKSTKAVSVRLDLRIEDKALARRFADAFVSALRAAEFRYPRYGAEPKEGHFVFAPRFELLGRDKGLEKVLARAAHEADGTNLVRELAMLAGNDLTPRNYVNRLKKEAKAEGLAFEFLDVKKLEKLGAGAFLAVVQASPEQDSGIVKLSYKPSGKASGKAGQKSLSVVGKGITFDTGGTNLKGAAHMFGMHRDMAGSAVAYALVRLAAREKWSFPVTAYLAIADNLTGAKAYRPNDVITAANGRTIEIVHTDAEGRMILADTLYLASQDEPELLLDFATLTGACVGAIGNNYSGAFTNRNELHELIRESGKESGERVWPFPMDEDYGDCLKSDIADTKQCRITGGVDHIEAALFLKSFLAKDCPWVHVDLSSADRSGGLAHIDGEVTGFGLRFASQLVRHLFPFR